MWTLRVVLAGGRESGLEPVLRSGQLLAVRGAQRRQLATAERQRALGAVYTPPEIVDFMVRLAQPA
ncbi:MAG: hypothetical protein NZ741_04690, partial [Armatimonadetes bacterium]|nr:hypothetical protein [Armatimonadota bacterium]